jgi:hypothetical protein
MTEQSTLQILPCKSPDLGIEMRGRDARARQVEGVEEYLHNTTFVRKKQMMIM